MERLNCKETKNALSQSERENQIFGQEILSYFRETDTLAVQAKLGRGLSQLCSLRGHPEEEGVNTYILVRCCT